MLEPYPPPLLTHSVSQPLSTRHVILVRAII